jgi:hypothetical protein
MKKKLLYIKPVMQVGLRRASCVYKPNRLLTYKQ